MIFDGNGKSVGSEDVNIANNANQNGVADYKDANDSGDGDIGR